MSFIALVSLPVFNVAHCHLLVLTPKSKVDLIKFYNDFFGGAFVLYHKHVKNRLSLFESLTQTFKSFPTGYTMMICGYDIPDIIEAIEASLRGESVNIERKHEVKYYSKELVEFVPQVKEDDTFFTGDDIESYGVFHDEDDGDDEEEFTTDDVTDSERQTLYDDEEEEDTDETRKFKEIERIMFSNMSF